MFNQGRDLLGDIEIQEGATLTIQCQVSLPVGAKIIIKPTGKLILDGGIVTNRCGDEWEGIEIWKSKNSMLQEKLFGAMEDILNMHVISFG